jgi:hypothetical protein
MPLTSPHSGTMRSHKARIERQGRFLEFIATGMMVKDALVEVGIPFSTYQDWRTTHKDFAAKVDAAKARAHRAWEGPPKRTGNHATFDFAVERLYYFGNESPAYQLEVVQAMETLPPGRLLLVLLPPNHGKTTMFEDYATLALAHDPSLRIHIGSESIGLARKILRRIQSRLENSTADPRLTDLICKYGPFAPPTDDSKRRGQPWRAEFFDIWRKGDFDERDYSVAALGFGSNVIGSRSDWLHADDVQSMKTLGQTETMIETFVQDWLSRPGKSGRTTIVGNRVDEGDFYEALMDRIPSDLLHIIRYPAIVERDGEAVPLWPRSCPEDCTEHEPNLHPGWTMQELDDACRIAGPATWERNWMQRPRAKMFQTFDERTVDHCLVPLRKLGHITKGQAHVIGVDPAIGNRVTPGAGRNAIITCEFTERGITPVLIREDRNFTNNSQILAAIEDQIVTVRAGGGFVSDVVIEENAFAKGLVYDPQLDALRHQYGFAVRPHTTGANKHDENIGVPSMVHTMLKDQIHLPWADDEYTRLMVGELRAQFLAWKPKLRGTQLRQDLLMAFWFVWILWRNRRGASVEATNGQHWQTAHRSPFKPTNGLVLPTGFNPTVIGSR